MSDFCKQTTNLVTISIYTIKLLCDAHILTNTISQNINHQQITYLKFTEHWTQILISIHNFKTMFYA